MSVFRNLLNMLLGEESTTQLHPPGRPTSLFEAGSVGSPGRRVTPPSPPREKTQGELLQHRNLYPESPLASSEAPRRKLAETVVARPRADSRAALRAALRSPASLRTAILVREVLDPPVSLRRDRR